MLVPENKSQFRAEKSNTATSKKKTLHIFGSYLLFFVFVILLRSCRKAFFSWLNKSHKQSFIHSRIHPYRGKQLERVSGIRKCDQGLDALHTLSNAWSICFMRYTLVSGHVDAIHIYESEWNQTVTLTLTFHSRVTLQTTNLGMLVRLVASIIHTNIVVGLSVS